MSRQMKVKNENLEKIPLLLVYKQGDEIFADQPEEIIDKFQFYAFLSLYTEMYGEKLKVDCFRGDLTDE